MDNPQAAITVFSIVELLEDILLNLPLRDLALAQRINKAVYNCVNNSTKIKQALFLAPATEMRLIFHGDAESGFHQDWKPVSGMHGLFKPLLNPFFRFEESRRLSPSQTVIEKQNFPATMLLTHPPIARLSMVKWARPCIGNGLNPYAHASLDEIDNPWGIRYGEYAEVLARQEENIWADIQEICRSRRLPDSLRWQMGNDIKGSDEWERVRKESVDTLAGHEMLRLMGMPNEKMLPALEALEERCQEVEEEHALKAVQRMFAIETEAA